MAKTICGLKKSRLSICFKKIIGMIYIIYSNMKRLSYLHLFAQAAMHKIGSEKSEALKINLFMRIN
jgi:hypothetical protein